MDLRMGSAGAGKLGVYKTLQAHSKGHITALECHPHSPLIASATTTQARIPCCAKHCAIQQITLTGCEAFTSHAMA